MNVTSEQPRISVDLTLQQVQWLRQHLDFSVRQGGMQHARTGVLLDVLLENAEKTLTHGTNDHPAGNAGA